MPCTIKPTSKLEVYVFRSRSVLSVVALLALLGPSSVASAQSAPFCDPGKSPEFVFGFKDLRDAVGDAMGQPTECEHAEATTGDSHQQTSTGLSFYRKRTNTPTFTNGSEHWALTRDGLVTWTGSSIEPPAPDNAPDH
jgi:hypothetical protein